jgi:hypothetical protein
MPDVSPFKVFFNRVIAKSSKYFSLSIPMNLRPIFKAAAQEVPLPTK